MKEYLLKILSQLSEDWNIVEYEESKFIRVIISGGENGLGKFSNYTLQLNSLANKLEETFSEVWLIKWENDVLDDIWYLELGLMP